MVSSSYEDEQADLDALVIQKVNYGLAAAYMILGILAIIQVVVKYKAEKKIKTSVVFPAEIFVLCLVRAVYFILSLTNWADKRTPESYSFLVLFIDTLPELIYVAIYVLLVASWGVTWGKARRARPFSARQFWGGYAGIVVGMFVVSFILSIISSQSFRLNYENILLWEGAYLIFLCANFLFAAIIFGVKLYSMLKKTAYVGTSSSTMSLLDPQQQSRWSKASAEPSKSTPSSSSSSSSSPSPSPSPSSDSYKSRVKLGWERAWSGLHSSWSQASSTFNLSFRSSTDSNSSLSSSSSSSSRPRPTLASGGEAMLHVMRQLLALVVLVSVSFVLKAACIFSFATSARHEWIYSEWTTTTFAICWVLYFAISELIPFVLVWIVLQRKDASSSRTTSSYSLNTKATRMSYISGRMSENARRAKERQVNLFVQGEKQVDAKEESSYAYQDASDLG